MPGIKHVPPHPERALVETVTLRKDDIELLERIALRTNMSIEELVVKGAMNYGEIDPRIVTFGNLDSEVKITEDGKLIVDIPKALAHLLDIDGTQLSLTTKTVVKNGKTRYKTLPRPREEILILEAPLIAFLYHLATANELPWYWDQTGWRLAEAIVEAGKKVNADWEKIKSTAEHIVSAIWSLYPHLWGGEYASKFASEALEKLKEKYPEFKVYRAEKQAPCMDAMPGVTVVVEWPGGKECFNFVD